MKTEIVTIKRSNPHRLNFSTRMLTGLSILLTLAIVSFIAVPANASNPNDGSGSSSSPIHSAQVKVVSVSVTPASAQVQVGAAQQFTAIAFDRANGVKISPDKVKAH